MEEAEDFLAVANPALLRCFEDAERTFSLDKDDLDCSQLATNAYTHDRDSGEESGEESYGETVHLLSRSIRTEDAAEDSTVESFFSETCHCTLRGLSRDRQWYLYEHIREFCTTEEAADSTCPKPSLPKSTQQNSSAVLPATSELQSEPQSTATTSGKCQRLCSVCHCPGHNKHSCAKKVNT